MRIRRNNSFCSRFSRRINIFAVDSEGPAVYGADQLYLLSLPLGSPDSASTTLPFDHSRFRTRIWNHGSDRRHLLALLRVSDPATEPSCDDSRVATPRDSTRPADLTRLGNSVAAGKSMIPPMTNHSEGSSFQQRDAPGRLRSLGARPRQAPLASR